jgi:hypothetical protein
MDKNNNIYNEIVFYVELTKTAKEQLDLVEKKKKELNIENYKCKFSHSTYNSRPKYYFRCIKE